MTWCFNQEKKKSSDHSCTLAANVISSNTHTAVSPNLTKCDEYVKIKGPNGFLMGDVDNDGTGKLWKRTTPRPRGQGRRFISYGKKMKRWTNRRRIWDSLIEAHQKDNVGVLIERSAHADPLSLTSTKVDALGGVSAGGEEEDEMTSSTHGSNHPARQLALPTRSPISVWSLNGSRSMSGCREQASITALYLREKGKTGWSLKEEQGGEEEEEEEDEEEKETLWAARPLNYTKPKYGKKKVKGFDTLMMRHFFWCLHVELYCKSVPLKHENYHRAAVWLFYLELPERGQSNGWKDFSHNNNNPSWGVNSLFVMWCYVM